MIVLGEMPGEEVAVCLLLLWLLVVVGMCAGEDIERGICGRGCDCWWLYDVRYGSCWWFGEMSFLQRRLAGPDRWAIERR